MNPILEKIIHLTGRGFHVMFDRTYCETIEISLVRAGQKISKILDLATMHENKAFEYEDIVCMTLERLEQYFDRRTKELEEEQNDT